MEDSINVFFERARSLTLEQVVSHKHCDLGKWIYAEGIDKYSNLPSMKELEDVHKTFHATIRNVLEYKNAGQIEEAEKEYEIMKEISEIIVQLLTLLEQEYQSH